MIDFDKLGSYLKKPTIKSIFQAYFYVREEGAPYSCFPQFIRLLAEGYVGTPGVPAVPSVMAKWNKITKKFEAIHANLEMDPYFVENANGNLFARKTTVSGGSITDRKNYNSTDGGTTWEEVTLEYFPEAFNSQNNFISNTSDSKFWFSDLADSKIYEYQFNPKGQYGVEGLYFDKNDYLYSMGNGIFYKSKAPVLKP